MICLTGKNFVNLLVFKCQDSSPDRKRRGPSEDPLPPRGTPGARPSPRNVACPRGRPSSKGPQGYPLPPKRRTFARHGTAAKAAAEVEGVHEISLDAGRVQARTPRETPSGLDGNGGISTAGRRKAAIPRGVVGLIHPDNDESSPTALPHHSRSHPSGGEASARRVRRNWPAGFADA